MKLTKEDVWGKFDENTYQKLSDGMIVSRTGEKCSIFNDIVPFKSVTVVCNAEQMDEVESWLIYVHGSDCVSQRKDLPNNKVAIRSDYMCW